MPRIIALVDNVLIGVGVPCVVILSQKADYGIGRRCQVSPRLDLAIKGAEIENPGMVDSWRDKSLFAVIDVEEKLVTNLKFGDESLNLGKLLPGEPIVTPVVGPIVIEGDLGPDERASHKNGWTGYERENGGMYLSTRVNDPGQAIYVDIRSSNNPLDQAVDGHATFHSLMGKRVRVTIEVIGEAST